MIRTTRASFNTKMAVCAACLACAWLLATALAADAAATIVYQNESFNEYQQQLAGGQIRAVTINRDLRSLRVTLKDGRYVLAKYAPHEEPTLAAALQAKHVPVTVLTPTEAKKEVKKPHHKLRYIAGGILIVVIIVVGTVLLVDRRRKRAME